MPSGAKKRKAAKKKKENQSINEFGTSFASSTDSHGNEEVEQLEQFEDKEGCIGDVSSSLSGDHHSQQKPLSEAKEEGIEKEIDVAELSSAGGSGMDVVEKHIVVEEDNIQVGWDFKIKNGSDGRIEHFEVERKSHNGGSCGSSSSRSSSSDDENHGVKISQAAANTALVVDPLSARSAEDMHSAPIRECGDLVMGSIPAADSERNSELAKQVEVENVLNNKRGEKVGTSVCFVDAASDREVGEIDSSVEDVSTIYDPKEHVAQENYHRLSAPQNAPTITADNNGTTTEPLLVPSPCPVQKTSWKSCCGLFDLFSGSAT